MNENEKEKQRLKTTISAIKDNLHSIREMMKNNTSNENLYSLITQRIRQEENLTKAEKKPYFARIDFLEDDAKEKGVSEIYIGKCSVLDNENKVLVSDWRAPVSSLYYDGRLGNVSYEAPEGEISGELLLKRLYEIENGELLSFSDVDITTNDELLKPYLNANSDKRLKNIISTIQGEQNKIIRAKLNRPLIVQGVAGSGKTTVALHRIAYLIYEHAETLKPEDFLIIAPNKFFLDYISDTLPDLGVDNVSQLTFEEFAEQVIGEKLKIENSNNKLADIVNDSKEMENIQQKVASFKSSMKYKEMLDRYLENLEENYLPDEDLKVGEFIILSKEKLKENFQKTETYKDNSLEKKFQIFMARLEYFIKNNGEEIEDLIIESRKKELAELNPDSSDYDNEKIAIFDKYDVILEPLKKNGKKLLSDYSKKIKKRTALDYYKDFISKIDDYAEETIDTEILDYIKEKMLNQGKNKQVEYEDLAPLMHIKHFMTDNEKIKDYKAKHIVIDEAQDYSVFQFIALNERLQNNSMTILGDIAQGIYSYRGISDWEDVNQSVFEGKANILELGKSYRTTMEVMDKANDVLDKIKDRIKVKPAEPVIRRGEEIRIKGESTQNEIIQDMILRINELLAGDSKNIAVISKTLQEAKKLSKGLDNNNIPNTLISDKSVEYKGGVTVVPSYLSKGLEFDSVLLSNASEEQYKNNDLDAKLLYVAITRAMHSLDIYYTGKPSTLLEEREKEKKNQNYKEDEERG